MVWHHSGRGRAKTACEIPCPILFPLTDTYISYSHSQSNSLYTFGQDPSIGIFILLDCLLLNCFTFSSQIFVHIAVSLTLISFSFSFWNGLAAWHCSHPFHTLTNVLQCFLFHCIVWNSFLFQWNQFVLACRPGKNSKAKGLNKSNWMHR